MKNILSGLCLMFLLLILLSTSVLAFTATPMGTEVQVKYVEPITNVDGSILKDLSKTKIYWIIVGSGVSATAIDVPATAINGGGNILQSILIPVSANQEADVEVWATAVDKSGNESPASTKVTIRIDRLSPSEPQ